MIDNAVVLTSLKADLNRSGNFPDDDNYLLNLIKSARAWLVRQGVVDDESDDFGLILSSTAAWIYRKRITGESEPVFLKRMRHDFIVSAKGGLPP